MSHVRVSKLVWTWIGVLTLGGIITMIALLALTVNKEVKQDELLLTINMYTGDLRGPFAQGRYNLAVGDDMVHFKRTVQPHRFSITCFSRDMLRVTLEVTVMFQYVTEQIIPVLMHAFFDEQYYLADFDAQVTGSTWRTCSNFTAEDYYARRQSAEVSLLADLRNALLRHPEPSVVHIAQLQLTNIAFPSEFNAVIAEKLQKQAQQTATLNTRQSQLTNANTQLQAARQMAAITLIDGKQRANVLLTRANATRQISVDSWNQRALAFKAAQTALSLDDVGLVAYIQSEVLRLNGKSIVTA